MRTKSTVFVLFNTISFLVALYINYASQTPFITNITMAEVAHKYDTLFAPADYAFFFWIIIYIFCAGFIIYQWVLIKHDVKQYIQRTGIWFIITNLANAAWVYCWVHQWLGWCVVLMLVLLFSLIMLTVKLRLELDDEPVKTIFLVWWPIVFYLGWVVTAIVACIAAWLVFIGWNGSGIAPDLWTIITIALACLIYIFLLTTRNMREGAIAGIWAFIAIAVRQWNVHTNIAVTAVIGSIILFVLIAIHSYKNRQTNPANKIRRGEW